MVGNVAGPQIETIFRRNQEKKSLLSYKHLSQCLPLTQVSQSSTFKCVPQQYLLSKLKKKKKKGTGLLPRFVSSHLAPTAWRNALYTRLPCCLGRQKRENASACQLGDRMSIQELSKMLHIWQLHKWGEWICGHSGLQGGIASLLLPLRANWEHVCSLASLLCLQAALC